MALLDCLTLLIMYLQFGTSVAVQNMNSNKINLKISEAHFDDVKFVFLYSLRSFISINASFFADVFWWTLLCHLFL
jgi:hypothetical protein